MLSRITERPTALFLSAIGTGSLMGAVIPATTPAADALTDPLIVILVTQIFFTLRLPPLLSPALTTLKNPGSTPVVLAALLMNFVAIPVIIVAVTSLVLPPGPLQLGVFLYCLFPCTDWFLGFTRAADGDTAVGGLLIPLQMAAQVLLYPVWLGVLPELTGATEVGTTGASTIYGSPEVTSTLAFYVLIPACAGIGLQVLSRRSRMARWARDTADDLVPVTLAAIIMCLFTGNVSSLLVRPADTLLILVTVFIFFVAAYLLGEGTARVLGLPYPEKSLLVITTSARNAPLMIALTSAFLPEHPEVTAVLAVGMLVEFPHLCTVTHLLRRQCRSLPATVSHTP